APGNDAPARGDASRRARGGWRYAGDGGGNPLATARDRLPRIGKARLAGRTLGARGVGVYAGVHCRREPPGGADLQQRATRSVWAAPGVRVAWGAAAQRRTGARRAGRSAARIPL